MRVATPEETAGATTTRGGAEAAPGLDADALARELDALRDEVLGRRGQVDVDHIRRVLRAVQLLGGGGRLLLHFGLGPASFVLGTSAVALAKILENMEVGHNVMHGQYDFTRDPALASRDYEWDIVCPSDDWRPAHNFEHHTFTNVVDRDRDVGYVFFRVCDEQPWRPYHLAQPLALVGLALGFQWGVALHNLRFEEYLDGRLTRGELADNARPLLAKAARQLARDYLVQPALALLNAPRVALGNLLANTARNTWAFTIIFCGHFPEGVRVFSAEALEGETRAGWYRRQIAGSANIEASGRHAWLLHLLTGHLSFQIEHHLFPDLPASRYPEMAPRVREICQRHGLPYRTGSLAAQVGSVARRLLRLSLPGPKGPHVTRP